MEIIRTSYFEKLPEIKEAISKATFLSIDCELSGLNTVFDITAYDTPAQYFEKVRKSSKDFLVIQFGLSIFRRENDCFKHKTYNFYIFPSRSTRLIPDQRFLSQASSIHFLISHGFDFNKLFKEGISYLNNEHISKYKEVLEEAKNARNKFLHSPPNLSTISVPEEDKPFIDKVFMEIEEFIKSDRDEHILPKCNAFVRRLIYQTAQGRIDHRASIETRQIENNERVLVVTRPKSIEERRKDMELKAKEEAEEFRQAIGFSKLMQYISASRKLIVGHNMMLDICHSIDKFLAPLPENYQSFKECVHSFFPHVIDTKYMSSVAPFKDLITSTILAQLLSTVTSEPFTTPKLEAEANSVSYRLDEPKEHEAGYDAFITGVSFISMWQHLGEQNFNDFNLLAPYMNKLYLMRIQDSPYIQLDGTDPNPRRDHVFYLTFPKDWKLNDITQLFSPFGNIYVAWVDEKSAYIALYKRDQAAIVMSTLSQSDTYHIMTYAQRQAELGSPYKPTKIKNVKKRKSSVSGEMSATKKISIEPFCEIEDHTIPCLIAPRKRTISKTFEENNSWN